MGRTDCPGSTDTVQCDLILSDICDDRRADSFSFTCLNTDTVSFGRRDRLLTYRIRALLSDSAQGLPRLGWYRSFPLAVVFV